MFSWPSKKVVVAVTSVFLGFLGLVWQNEKAQPPPGASSDLDAVKIAANEETMCAIPADEDEREVYFVSCSGFF